MKTKPSPEVPKEYTAFKDLLRQVVKPVSKPVAPAPVERG